MSAGEPTCGPHVATISKWRTVGTVDRRHTMSVTVGWCLAGLAKDCQTAKKTDGKEKGSKVYACTLKEAAVKQWAPTEVRGVARGGTVTLWVDAKGNVVKYSVTLTLKGRLGGAEVDGTQT